MRIYDIGGYFYFYRIKRIENRVYREQNKQGRKRPWIYIDCNKRGTFGERKRESESERERRRERKR